ncbi:MAG: terpene cyclase/mutase family protein, partial [Planctomycetota bacterium]|nr:terpene cyclase/mutase family protein [Planctomycetota bacterium]
MARGKRLALFGTAILALAAAGAIYAARNYLRHTPGRPLPVSPSGDRFLDAIRRGLAFLQAHQEEDGHFVAGFVAPKASFTALVIEAAVHSPDRLHPKTHPWLAKAVQALLAEQKPDGGIYTKIPGMSFGNYSTSLAVMALSALQDPQYKPAIDRACAYLRKGQRAGDASDPLRGGIDYGGSGKPDLNNTMTMLEALRAAGVPADDPAYKAAVEFIQNTQNRSESNPQPWAGDDGGFIYRPA